MVLPPCVVRPLTDVGEEGAADTHEIESVVIVEPLILDRQHRIDEMRRDLVERHLDALLLVNRERDLTIRGQNRRRLIHLAQALQRGDVRQTGREERDGDGDRGQGGDRQGDHRTGRGAWMSLAKRRPAMEAGLPLADDCVPLMSEPRHERWRVQQPRQRRRYRNQWVFGQFAEVWC